MHWPLPISARVRGTNGPTLHRLTLEQAPPNGRYNDKRLGTLLGRRLRNSYPVPSQEDEAIRQMLQKLAAKLREPPPA